MLPPESTLYPTVPELLDKLAALGDHEHIALHLRELGVTGVTGSPNSCAVAQYLRARTAPEPTPRPQIGVGAEAVHQWQYDPQGLVLADHAVPVPPAVAAFIKAFDNRCYPDLIDHQHPSEGAPLATLVAIDVAQAIADAEVHEVEMQHLRRLVASHLA